MAKRTRAQAADLGAAVASGQDSAAEASLPSRAPQDQRDLATAATDLARQARAMVIESLGRAMTGEQRARTLHAMHAGAPVAVSIRLTVPQAVTVWLGRTPRSGRVRPRDPPMTTVDDGGHPAVRDHRTFWTCAVCLRRALMPALDALHHGQKDEAEIILLRLWIDLDQQIQAAVAADQGALQ
jgi:hypothetical protein